MRACCICGEAQGVTLFCFPWRNLQTLELWKKACGFKTRDVSRLKVCSKHFQHKDLVEPNYKKLNVRCCLKPDAVPTLNLPRLVKSASLSGPATVHFLIVTPITTNSPTIANIPTPVLKVLPNPPPPTVPLLENSSDSTKRSSDTEIMVGVSCEPTKINSQKAFKSRVSEILIDTEMDPVASPKPTKNGSQKLFEPPFSDSSETLTATETESVSPDPTESIPQKISELRSSDSETLTDTEIEAVVSSEPIDSRPRKLFEPRYIGEVRDYDFEVPGRAKRIFKMAKAQAEKWRKKSKHLGQQVRRLQDRVKCLQELVEKRNSKYDNDIFKMKGKRILRKKQLKEETAAKVAERQKSLGIPTEEADWEEIKIVVGPDTENSMNPLYCICQKEELGTPMIACDSDKCHIKYFHFSCVGLTEVPAGLWFCEDCQVMAVK